jgi:ribosomal protein S13
VQWINLFAIYTVRNSLNNITAIKLYGKFLIIGYKSIRKSQGLPCRGQQTQSNAKTASKINNILIKIFTRKKKVNLRKSTKVSQTKGRIK